MTAPQWVQAIQPINDAALQWYAITHNSTIPQRTPNSLMGAIVGTDYGGGSMAGTSPLAGGATLAVLGILAVAFLVLRK